MLDTALFMVALGGLPRGLTVDWEGPPDCPSADAVRANLKQALENAPPGPPRTIHGRVSLLAEGGYQLDVVTRGPEFGEATKPPVTAGNCGDLAREFEMRSKQLWLVDAAERPRSSRRPAGRVRLAGQAGYGLINHQFGGGQIVFGLAWRYARVELGVEMDGNQGVRLAATTLKTSWLRGSFLLRGCGELPRRSLDIHLCAGADVGVIAGKTPRWSSHVTSSVHLAPAITWWFARWVGLWLGVTGGLFVRPLAPCREDDPFCSRLPLNSPQPDMSWWFLAGGLGLEFRWDR